MIPIDTPTATITLRIVAAMSEMPTKYTSRPITVAVSTTRGNRARLVQVDSAPSLTKRRHGHGAGRSHRGPPSGFVRHASQNASGPRPPW